ncbi:hypothetical protein [Pseudomonas sp. MWU16-30323]|jgi:hypothetical protein|uniref:hypothetical protein n=1 Tax=Pseudomonas sp. MWU16-30323 TaxID=2878094 RepID=UPI001CF9BF25|nr:hypothetical protein [Pseudomonas sp. MWU16-30323]
MQSSQIGKPFSRAQEVLAPSQAQVMGDHKDSLNFRAQRLRPQLQDSGVGDSGQGLQDVLKQLNALIEKISTRMHQPTASSDMRSPSVPAPLERNKAPADRTLPIAGYNEKRVNALYDNGVQTAPEEQGFFLGAAKDAGIKPKDIFTGFVQTGSGNCVAVSAMKLAMMKFGHNPHGIYKKIEAVDNGFTITMRDNYTLHVTHDELKQVNASKGFDGDVSSETFKHAVFLFAVSAKRLQLEKYAEESPGTLAAAIDYLNSGDYPGEALRRLGLTPHMAPATMKELRQGVAGSVATGRHMFVVVDGYMDDYGKKAKLAGSGKGLPGTIALKLI